MQRVSIKTRDSIVEFLHNSVQERGFQKVVLGLSGGIDSAVVAALCKMAFEKNGGHGIATERALKVLLMPSTTSSPQSITDSVQLCEQFDICYEIHAIAPFDSLFCESYPNHTQLERGNFCSRMRMNLLYFIAQQERRLVIGTSNKTEIMLGYGTIFGDLACALNPIGNLYKTQIYELAQILGIPDSIIQKPPSADLYEGQSDEAEIGYSYDSIDPFLEAYLKNNVSAYPEDMRTNLIARIRANAFKMQPITIHDPIF